MEAELGPSDHTVYHAVTPFIFGFEAGGKADVVSFRNHIQGSIFVTCELIGNMNQIQNSIGNYELAIAHHPGQEWGVDIISNLAYYKLDAQIEPGQTMDLGPAAPRGSKVSAFLFSELTRFTVCGEKAGILLCIGITSEELAACRRGMAQRLEARLRSNGIYPFTDFDRPSISL